MGKINIGKMPCETCGNQVTVKQNENATLSYRCDECDAAPYAKTGTLQNIKWREKLAPLGKIDAQNDATNGLNIEVKPTVSPEKQTKPAIKTDMWGNAL